MDKSLLVKVFGSKVTFFHGDTLIWDRWVWMKERLKPVKTPVNVLDVGCGTGAFTIGLAKMGYNALGLSWDERNQNVARERARVCHADKAEFEIQDVRNLDSRKDLLNKFDIILCFENIEHILNEQKLMNDMTACLKRGGRLLLTTPNFNYIPITWEDNGPFHPVETGWHVRRGYTPEDFRRLCAAAGLTLDEISYCSGFLSQKVTSVLRTLNKIHPLVGFVLTFPLRVLPMFLDKPVTRALRFPGFSICMDAHKN